ncbi:hypothetical protein [Gimesia fumaroli]|uniref:Neutral metalloprotease n=1 Tax=Gimesia fumaroli TaxID=2527976 RepID=A0A518IAP0_9PLAN|nr:hypothetical protein [Gimesia fumaroli]QDV50112.1 hypothetical protein Enr17x_21490 [Gimesia fumaroli]
MLPRRFSRQFTLFIPISALLIALGILSVRTAPSKVSPTSRSEITIRKPVLAPTKPVDWNQPVNIIPTGNQLSIPLACTQGDEYLLIINNLERAPHRTQKIQLSTVSDSSEKTPTGCYFQNTQTLPRTTHSSPQAVTTQQIRRSRKKSESNSNPKPPAKKRSFYLFVTDGSLSDRNQYTRITGQLIQHSDRVAIYLDEQQKTSELTPGLVEGILETLEHQVLDKITNRCGPIRDIDEDGRFTILLSPWLSKLQGGKTSINGFVRPSDFRKTVSEPFSNHCDMLYLNSTLKSGQELLDLLSHEVTHAAVSSLRAVHSNSPAGPLMDEEDWLNEGIAHIMEPGYTNRDYRISEFYRKPEAYPLVIPDYYRAQLWRNHGCRGAVNLFLDWCNQLETTQRFPYRFTHHPLTGTPKIEQLTARPFPELFRLWSLNLAQQTLWTDNRENSDRDRPTWHCGKFLLTGPAFHTWDLSHEPGTSLNIASTASGFLHLKRDSSQSENIIIKVNGFSKMQLTLLKMPQCDNRLSLTVKQLIPSTNDISATEFLDVRLTCQHPARSLVETISLEFSGAYLSRTSRQPRRFQTANLNSSLTSQSGNWEVANEGTHQEGGVQVTDFLIRIPRTTLQKQAEADCLTFKTVVQTEIQTRIAMQTDFKLPPHAIPRLTEASKPPKN